jgi:hypothetical protein
MDRSLSSPSLKANKYFDSILAETPNVLSAGATSLRCKVSDVRLPFPTTGYNLLTIKLIRTTI